MSRVSSRNLPLGPTAALLVAVATYPLTATAAKDLMGTRAAAMGGALRATSSGVSAVFLNPAGMSLARQYALSAMYQFRSSDTGSQLNASIVDSVTSKIAAGLFYNFVVASPKRTLAIPGGNIPLNESSQTHEVGLALSLPLGQMLMIGVSTRYLSHRSTVGEESIKVDTTRVSSMGLDVGGIVRLGQYLSLAVVGHNLVPAHAQLYPQSLGLGAALTAMNWLTATFDSVVDFTSDPDGVSANFHAGLEGFFDQAYAVRLGAEHQMAWGATYVTCGGGLVSRNFGLELSLRQQVDGGRATIAGVSLNVYVQ